MYRLKIVGTDFKAFEIDALEEELDVMLSSIKEKSVFFNGDKTRGIYIPYPSIRYIYIEKRGEECQQNNLNSEVESDLPSSKEN